MIDYIALGLTHALIMLALLRVLVRPDLDREDPLADEPETIPAPPPSPRDKRRARQAGKRSGGA
ncbi:hypothetical protein Q9K02_02150 [Qipengyuania sp. G39]|uniref:Cell envelope biogenesis protein TolA n=1 Tax=Qipengyuania profundimaris TaxID=3067652 RepID=A0ABT9HLB4_9SPHN|nr:hypothetical protein [Qipengyuania sp. G39]MDP4573940.1 hypothetical protein [Qipengyuania sp. G39]